MTGDFGDAELDDLGEGRAGEGGVRESRQSWDGRGASHGRRTRHPTPISGYPIIAFIDTLMLREGDSRADRLQKVSSFCAALFFAFVFALYSVAAGAAGSGSLPAGGLVISVLLVVFFLVIAVALVWRKSVRLAQVFGHLIAAMLTVIAPPLVVFLNGVGVIDKHGRPIAYQFTYFICAPVLVAFVLRSARSVVVYSGVVFTWIIVGTAWNPRRDNLHYSVSSLLIVVMSFLIAVGSSLLLVDMPDVYGPEAREIESLARRRRRRRRRETGRGGRAVDE